MRCYATYVASPGRSRAIKTTIDVKSKQRNRRQLVAVQHIELRFGRGNLGPSRTGFHNLSDFIGFDRTQNLLERWLWHSFKLVISGAVVMFRRWGLSRVGRAFPVRRTSCSEIDREEVHGMCLLGDRGGRCWFWVSGDCQQGVHGDRSRRCLCRTEVLLLENPLDR